MSEWHHIAFVHREGCWRVYVDGEYDRECTPAEVATMHGLRAESQGARGVGAAYLAVAAEHHEAIEQARRIVAKGEGPYPVLESALVAIDEAMRSELTADQ